MRKQYFDELKFRNLKQGEIFTTKQTLVSPMKGENKWGESTRPDNTLEGLFEVYDCAMRCRRQEWPKEFNEKIGLPETPGDLPEVLFNILNDEKEMHGRPSFAEAASYLVEMDHPMMLAYALLDHYWPKRDNHILFVERREVEAIIAKVVHKALEEVFKVKWFWLTARPIEKLHSVSPIFKDQHIECYPHPDHAANGAGHGAYSAAIARAIIVLLKLKKVDAEDVEVTGEVFGDFRSYSFMHTVKENQVGALIGKAVAAEVLETYSVE